MLSGFRMHFQCINAALHSYNLQQNFWTLAGLTTIAGSGLGAIEAAFFSSSTVVALGIAEAGALSVSARATLNAVSRISKGDFFIISQGMRTSTESGFTSDLIALNGLLGRIPSPTTLQMNNLGSFLGNPVYGSLRTGVGIVDIGGVTMVVQMSRDGRLIRVLGPFR